MYAPSCALRWGSRNNNLIHDEEENCLRIFASRVWVFVHLDIYMCTHWENHSIHLVYVEKYINLWSRNWRTYKKDQQSTQNNLNIMEIFATVVTGKFCPNLLVWVGAVIWHCLFLCFMRWYKINNGICS